MCKDFEEYMEKRCLYRVIHTYTIYIIYSLDSMGIHTETMHLNVVYAFKM